MVQQVEKRPRGRPRKDAVPPEPEEEDLIGAVEESTNLELVWAGVSVSWLSKVFGGERDLIRKKLAKGGCKPVGMNRGTPTFNLKEAAACLVTPKFSIEDHLKSMRYNDLPPMLQAAYWDGKLKRQQFEKNAGELWHTTDVQNVLGDAYFAFASTVKLWVEALDRKHGITPEQRTTLVALSDNLLADVHQRLVEAPKRGNTPSSVVDLEARLATGEDEMDVI